MRLKYTPVAVTYRATLGMFAVGSPFVRWRKLIKTTRFRNLIEIKTASGKLINLEFNPVSEWRYIFPPIIYIDSFNGICRAWVIDLVWVCIEIEL